MIFQPFHPSFGFLTIRKAKSVGGWSLSGRLRVKVKPTLDRTPCHGRATHTLPHSLTRGQYRHASEPHVHILGMWEETGVPRENCRRHGENVHRRPPVARNLFSPLDYIIFNYYVMYHI